jgi:uncharacterized protein YndB with AHSA1/START domain
MSPIVTTLEIARPPAEVFAYVTDPSRFPEWQRDVVGVRIEGARPPGVGSRFTTTRRIGKTKRTMKQTQEITEITAPRSWTARGVDGPIRAHGSVTVEPLNGDTRSRVRTTLDFEGHGIGIPLVPLFVPLLRRQVEKVGAASYENLKRLLESGGDRMAR